MPWIAETAFIPCCGEMKGLLTWLPYYRAGPTAEGLVVDNRIKRLLFRFCPFCGDPTTEVM